MKVIRTAMQYATMGRVSLSIIVSHVIGEEISERLWNGEKGSSTDALFIVLDQ